MTRSYFLNLFITSNTSYYALIYSVSMKIEDIEAKRLTFRATIKLPLNIIIGQGGFSLESFIAVAPEELKQMIKLAYV